jgi:2-oxoacid:acceptor oxidoreductase gamma subunit (pyruvate/2-ketoisovalerate family)
LIEVRFHGRGGQGAVIASNILANAAFMENKEVQAFPYFGVERRGAPVTAFTRIDDKPIRIRHEIYEPDYVVVLDIVLMKAVDVTQGLKKGGLLVINTDKPPEKFTDKWPKVATVDATGIALKYKLGNKMAPIVNTSILGGFVGATKLVTLEDLKKATMDMSPMKKVENASAAEEAYRSVRLLK